MPGPSNSTNRFGPSSYVCGPVLGNGVNFTSIQDAINQAVADGFTSANPCTILVRPGTYSSFTMAPGILIEGVCAGSAFSNTAAVIGNITIDSTTAGGNTYSLKNLNVSDPADAVIIQGVGPAIFVDIANCSFNGTRGLVVGNTSGTLSQIAVRECRITGSSVAVDLQLHNTVFTEQSTFQGDTVFLMSGDSRAALFDCVLDATANYGIQMTGSVNRLSLNFTNIDSPLESIFGTNNGETVQVSHCTFTSSAPSGNFIDAVDIFEFYDVALKGTALLNNATATNFIDWKPHAGVAANATLPGGVRGTSCFDTAAFTVTDGFVALSGTGSTSQYTTDSGTANPVGGNINIFGGPGVTTTAAGDTITINSVVWTDTTGPLSVTSDSGSFDQAAGALTLPAAPAQGDECRFFSINSPSVIQASGAQTIQIGNLTSSAGGTATGSDTGDSLFLIYNAATNRWCSIATNGNWILA